MKRLLLFTIIVCLFASLAQAQDDVKLSAEYDVSLDCSYPLNGNGGIRVFSPYDDLIVMVTSGNMDGEMVQKAKDADGNFEYIVPINIDNNQEAHFVFTRRGSTIKAEFSEKRLKADHLLGYKIRSVANPIRLSYQPTVGDMYPSATEGLVEISTAFEKLNIHVPSALPFNIEEGKQENDSSINVYKIIVPVAKIKELKEKYEAKSKEYEELDNALIEAANGDDPRWAELDKMEIEVGELQAAVAEVQQIDLNAPKSNSLSIDISQMGPRSKMVVAVVPIVQTIVKNVYKNPYDNYMAQAQDAYDNRKYGTAKKLYLQAQQAEGISALQASTAQECANTMDGLADRMQTVKNCAATWKKMQNEGQVQRHLAEECIELAMTNLQQLYELTHDEYYASKQRSYQRTLAAFPVVVEGKLKVKNYNEGVMRVISLNKCDIYASVSKKDKEGTKVGSVENDGSFHVQFERGKYVRLLLKPQSGSPLLKPKEIKLQNNGFSSMTIEKDFEP